MLQKDDKLKEYDGTRDPEDLEKWLFQSLSAKSGGSCWREYQHYEELKVELRPYTKYFNCCQDRGLTKVGQMTSKAFDDESDSDSDSERESHISSTIAGGSIVE